VEVDVGVLEAADEDTSVANVVGNGVEETDTTREVLDTTSAEVAAGDSDEVVGMIADALETASKELDDVSGVLGVGPTIVEVDSRTEEALAVVSKVLEITSEELGVGSGVLDAITEEIGVTSTAAELDIITDDALVVISGIAETTSDELGVASGALETISEETGSDVGIAVASGVAEATPEEVCVDSVVLETTPMDEEPVSITVETEVSSVAALGVASGV
jgi:hypothetical protein